MFGGSWEPGTATIIERRKVREGEFGHTSQYRFVADVQVPGKPPFRATMRSPLMLPDRFLAPSAGQVVNVTANVKRQKAKFDRSGPGATPKGRDLAPLLQRYVNDRQAASTASRPGVRDEQLREIAELHERRQLTDAEYEQARQFIEQL